MDTFIILSPLVVGYLLKLNHQPTLRLIDKSLLLLVYLILMIMGMELAGIDNLAQELGGIASVVGVLIGLTLLANLIVLPVVDSFWPLHLSRGKGELNVLSMILESLQLAAVVVGGFCLGLLFSLPQHFLGVATTAILMFLLLLIGIQMRASGMSMRQIFLNPRGPGIAFIVLISSLVAGAGTALWFDMPVAHGLALASGVGWYSLSGPLIGAELGPIMGSIAFLADLSRELIAIVIIPLLMPRSPASAIGYGGATALDFTLPVIQRSGGPETVPVAIVSGFLLSFTAPVLIPLFIGMA